MARRRPTAPRRQVARPAAVPAAPVVQPAPIPTPNTRDYGKAPEATVPAPGFGIADLTRGL